jgi:RecG-like helicase
MNHISDSASALIRVFENKLKSIEEIKEEEEEIEEVKVVGEIKTKPKKGKDMNKLLLGGLGMGKTGK